MEARCGASPCLHWLLALGRHRTGPRIAAWHTRTTVLSSKSPELGAVLGVLEVLTRKAPADPDEYPPLTTTLINADVFYDRLVSRSADRHVVSKLVTRACSRSPTLCDQIMQRLLRLLSTDTMSAARFHACTFVLASILAIEDDLQVRGGALMWQRWCPWFHEHEGQPAHESLPLVCLRDTRTHTHARAHTHTILSPAAAARSRAPSAVVGHWPPARRA